MYRVKQVAAMWGVSPSTVYALVAAGKLRCSRIGAGRGCLRFSAEHLAAYLAAGEPPPPPVVMPPPAPRVALKHLRR